MSAFLLISQCINWLPRPVYLAFNLAGSRADSSYLVIRDLDLRRYKLSHIRFSVLCKICRFSRVHLFSYNSTLALTHWGLYHLWFRKWLGAWSAPSHNLIHCWHIVNWTLRNKLQWNINQNSCIFIHSREYIWKCHLQNGSHLVLASMC